jgi:predicted nuclease of predicted toxin-antitoxin system
MPRLVIRFLLDHNVPDSVGVTLRARGHRVVLVREILPITSPDQLIATISEDEGHVLVSCDRDFKRIAARIPRGARARFRRLSRISLECGEPRAAARIDAAMSLIESEYEIMKAEGHDKIFIVIQDAGIKTHR